MPQPPFQYESTRATTTAEDGRRRLLDGLFDGIRERREQRRQRQAGDAPPGPAPQGNTMFDNEGGIASIAKPKGFDKKNTDNAFGHYSESSDGKSKICYWKRDDYSPEAASAKKIDEVLKKGPHTIMAKDAKHPNLQIGAQDEMDAVYDCLNPGRWSGKGGPFEVTGMSVKTINGKNVLSVDVEFQGFDGRPTGQKRTVLLFNPDPAGKTLEHLWVEGSNAAETDRLQKAVVSSVKWRK